MITWLSITTTSPGFEAPDGTMDLNLHGCQFDNHEANLLHQLGLHALPMTPSWTSVLHGTPNSPRRMPRHRRRSACQCWSPSALSISTQSTTVE